MKCIAHKTEYCKPCGNVGNLPGLIPPAVVDQVNTAWAAAHALAVDLERDEPSDWAELADRHRALADAYHAVLVSAPAESVLLKLCISAEGEQRRVAKFWQEHADDATTRNTTY